MRNRTGNRKRIAVPDGIRALLDYVSRGDIAGWNKLVLEKAPVGLDHLRLHGVCLRGICLAGVSLLARRHSPRVFGGRLSSLLAQRSPIFATQRLCARFSCLARAKAQRRKVRRTSWGFTSCGPRFRWQWEDFSPNQPVETNRGEPSSFGVTDEE